MSERQKHERLDRAHQAAIRGDKFKLFLADPDVDAFFVAYERDQVERMLRADVGDDDARRSCALKLSAMREFRSFLATAVKVGDQASATLLKEATSHE